MSNASTNDNYDEDEMNVEPELKTMNKTKHNWRSNKQYAAARCAMAPDIHMYGKSASSGVEAMNRANKLVREKTEVDPLNTAILLLQLEGGRFNKWKKIAWATDMPLTPKGMDLMKDAFNDVNIREYKLNMQQNMSSHTTYKILVSKNTNSKICFGCIGTDERRFCRSPQCTTKAHKKTRSLTR